MSYELHIMRKVLSLCPYSNAKLRAWNNNDCNNSLDTLVLMKGSEILFESRCQTVSNTEGLIPGADYADTIAPGHFSLTLFVDQRKFNCPVHGISDTKTIGGESIGAEFTTSSDSARWLMHDWQKLKPSPAGTITRVAWSSGCIVLPTNSYSDFNQILSHLGFKQGDVISGTIYQEPS